MRKLLLLFFASVLFCVQTFAQIYVAKTGSDTNSGTLASPYLTIQKAASVATAGQTVYVRAGTYRETVVPANSGTAGSPITYQPYNGESVTISGTEPITTAWTVHSGNIYKTAMAADWMDERNNQSDQIFVNSSMVHLARWPNMPTSLDPSYPNKITATAFVSKVTTGNITTGSLTAAEAPPANSVGAEITVQPNNEGWSWIFSGKLTVVSGGTITFESFSGSGKDGEQNVYHPNSRYFLFNKLSLLDAPGEWYHDDATNQLYLWAPNGGVPSNVEAKKREYAFNISNRNYITIKGFNLFACAITTDDVSAGDHRAYDASGNTLYPWRGVTNPLAPSQNCIIDGINAKYLTHYTDVSGFTQFQWGMGSGMVISGSNHIIRNCTLDYSAGNGITLIGKKNKALYNTITNTAYSGQDVAAVHTGGTTSLTVEDNEIAYNTVRRTGRSGMTPRSNINSTWSNFEARLHHNKISEFGIQDWDVGGIYVTGKEGQPYSMRYMRMDHNIVFGARGYQNAGLYADYTSGVIIDHNLVYDVDIAIKAQGYDGNLKNNNTIIYNNTTIVRKTAPSFYDSPYSFGNSADNNGENQVGTVVKNNIALASIDGNERVYQSPPPGYSTFQRFEKAVTTPNYLHAQGDPLFTNWAGLDFTLQAASGAVNTGETLTSVVRDGITIPYFNDAAVGQVDMGAFERGAARWDAGANVPNVALTGISLPSTASVGVNLKLFLQPTFTPSNATNQNVTWSSSNTSIATVSSTGQVTGIALGTCTITATSVEGNFTSSTSLTVRAYNVGENVIAINAGGSDYGTSAGVFYSADTHFVGGNPASSGYFFDGTEDDELYRTLRYGTDFSYRIPVLNQAYKVTLSFTNWSGGAGSDMGNVFAEGVQVLTNTDAFVASGNQNLRAYNVTLNDFTVTDGFIDLRFVNTGTGNFSVCGISVVAASGNGDTTPPTAPTNLSATNLASTSFTLNWTASTDAVGVTGYDVYSGSTLVGSTTTATSINVTGLTASTAYSMTVRAKDAAGNNTTSAALTVTTSGTTSTLRTADNPANTVSGLDYSYYEGTWSALPNFDALTAAKQGNVTSFDLTPRNRNDNFGFRFTGFVEVPSDGTYTFFTTSDDGSKLFIGSTEVVNNDGLHGAQERSGTIGLKAGKHAITVTFFEAAGGETLTVSYSGPNVSKQTIPASALSRSTTSGFSGTYKITARHSSKALDVSSGSTADGANVQQYTANGSLAQQWIITATTGGYYKIVNKGSNKALEVASSGTADGSNVQQWSYSGANNQQWSIEATTDGFYRLLNRNSGKALDVNGGPGATQDGVNVHQWGYVGGTNQQWKLEQLSTATARTATSAAERRGEKGEKLLLYPNPVTNGTLTVGMNAADKDMKVAVTLSDMTGRIVYKTNFVSNGNSQELNIGKLKPGIYIIRMKGPNTDFNSKVVVE